MRRAVLFSVICALCGGSSRAFAQPADPPAWRIEGGAGVRWMGGQSLGGTTATETTGSGGTLALFKTASDLAAATGLDGHIGVRLTRSLVAEAEGSYLKPVLRVAISADAEGAAPVTATETVEQFTIGGGVRWSVPGRRWSPRFAPFVTAGGGYLRQLHSPATLVETGSYYQVGGGVSALLVRRGRFHSKGAGLRGDLRALIRSRGVAFDGGSKTSPAAGVSAFLRF